MRTIGYHWPADSPDGDRTSYCDYCGSVWRRSQLKRDRAGLLQCPKGHGRDIVHLSELQAANARTLRSTPETYVGGNAPTKTTEVGTALRTLVGGGSAGNS